MPYQSFRFHVEFHSVGETEFRDFFQTDDIDEAKDFAMRLVFDETKVVRVWDAKLNSPVRDFDAEIYRKSL